MSEETTTISWGSRLKNALMGILIGFALIIGAIVLIFWNERHSLHIAQSLEQTQKVLISVPLTPINNQNNLKVVYFSGLATTTDHLVDSIVGITLNAINLNRKVEMYQWKENVETKTEKQVGGSEKETKVYSYNKTWSDKLFDSSNFKDQQGHQNPSQMPLQSLQQHAPHVTVGDFLLPAELVTQIDVTQPVDLSKADKEGLKNKFNKPVNLINNELYLGQNYETPQLGDMRINLTAAYPQNVSIIGQQTGNSVQPYHAPAGETVLLLSTGLKSSDQMIADALSENALIAWILRGVSLIMLIGGFSLILNPLVVLADVLPFLGTIVSFGTGFVAFICGLSLWLTATAIAWFATRPYLSLSLMAILIASVYVLIKIKAKKLEASA